MKSSVGSLCNICLSTERNLYLLKDAQILPEWRDIGLDTSQGKICWECRAVMENMMAFRKRVVTAQQILNSNLERSKIQCLSNLTTIHKDSFDEIVVSKINDYEIPFVYVQGLDTEHYLDYKKESFGDDFDGLDSAFELPIVTNKDDVVGSDVEDPIIDSRDDIKKEINEAGIVNNDVEIGHTEGDTNKCIDHKKAFHDDLENHFDTQMLTNKDDANGCHDDSKGPIIDRQIDCVKKEIIGDCTDVKLTKHEKRKKVKITKDNVKSKANYLTTDISDEKINKRVTTVKKSKNTQENIKKLKGRKYETKKKGDIIIVMKNIKQLNRNEANLEDAFSVEKDYSLCSLTDIDLIGLREKDRNSSIFRRAKWKCSSCIVPFRSEHTYETHMADFHREIVGDFICGVCQSRFPNNVALEKHTELHTVFYKCEICKYKQHRYNLPRMLDHMKRNHSKEYSCSMCNATFNSNGAARYHIKTHNMKECHVCKKTFSDLKLHMPSHNRERTEQCHICHKSLKSKSSLRFHLMTHATPSKDEAYCAECDVQFKNKHIYRSHLKTNTRHTTADKECDYCHRKFISKFSLAKHISVIHYHKLDHVCHLCGKEFSIAGHLRNHILVHHEGGSKPRKHICDLCGKGFTIKKCLNDHMNSHTGARPYKCDKCPAQFGFKSALYMHNRLKHLKGKKGKKSPTHPTTLL